MKKKPKKTAGETNKLILPDDDGKGCVLKARELPVSQVSAAKTERKHEDIPPLMFWLPTGKDISKLNASEKTLARQARESLVGVFLKTPTPKILNIAHKIQINDSVSIAFDKDLSIAFQWNEGNVEAWKVIDPKRVKVTALTTNDLVDDKGMLIPDKKLISVKSFLRKDLSKDPANPSKDEVRRIAMYECAFAKMK